MDSIAIEVIAVGGRLVGRTASDRFNLRMLGLDDMTDDRNGSAIKRSRRQLTREFGSAFTLSKSRARSVSLPTPREVEALGYALAHAA